MKLIDDNNKEWYVYLDNNSPVAFVSLSSGVIKNVYSIKDEFLFELLPYVSKKTKIKDSIVTNAYTDVYKACGLVSANNNEYKNQE